MDAKDLRKLLENADDKLYIFASRETLNQYDLTYQELYDLITDFLSDEQKLKLLDYPHFEKLGPTVKERIIKLISDTNIQLQILYDNNIIGDFNNWQILNILQQTNDDVKLQILHDEAFIKEHEFTDINLQNIAFSLKDSAKANLLYDRELVKDKLHMQNWQIAKLIIDIPEEQKIEMADNYELESYLKTEVIQTICNSKKVEILLEREEFDASEKISIISSMETDQIVAFLKDYKDFCKQANIHPYEITKNLSDDKQKSLVTRLEDMELTLTEKREILAMLNTDVKKSIDKTNLPEKYKTAIDLQTTQYKTAIVVDLEKNLEDYRGLDNLIKVKPEKFTENEKHKFLQLCDICPQMQIISNLDLVEFYSTASEYKEAEEWISSILEKIKPEYSAAQKIAVIDNAIGRQISYAPDFGTEAFDYLDSRALWKIISSGYGVCNGIAKVEQNILSRVGIESKLVSSGTHTFLKLNDIELPLANGETVKGNTILDPTWNLTAHRFGGKPNNFCISYEQARQNDMDEGGKDHCCHKNDEELQDATLSLEEQSLRKLFTSVGLADKDGKFPIKDLLERSKVLHETYANNPEQNINAQFALLAEVCPEFAMCQDSSMSILSDVCLDNENLEFNKCTVSRVYEKTDEKQKPILYVYIDSNQLGEKFYFADKCQGRFVQLPQEEFVKRFECYEKDLEKNNGIRPWETNEKQTDTKSLANSSGNITIEEAEER